MTATDDVAYKLPNSLAAKVGLEGSAPNDEIRDVITKANGKPVHSMPELATTFEDEGVGNKMSPTVTRDGKIGAVKVAIADISRLKQG